MKRKTQSKKNHSSSQGGAYIVPQMYSQEANYEQKGDVIEHPARIIIIGPSGSGKTQLAVFLVTEHFQFDTLSIFASNLDQPLFIELREYMEKKIQKLGGDPEDYIHFSTSIDRSPQDYDPELQHLVIFDDKIRQKSKEGEQVADFFMKGRPNNISVIAVTQNLFNSNTQVRENANYLFAFAIRRPQDKLAVFNTYCSAHLTRPQFEQSFARATNKQSDDDRNAFFSVINTESSKPLGLMFRRGLVPYSLYSESLDFDEKKPPSLGGSKYSLLMKPKQQRGSEWKNNHGNGPRGKSDYQKRREALRIMKAIREEEEEEDDTDIETIIQSLSFR